MTVHHSMVTLSNHCGLFTLYIPKFACLSCSAVGIASVYWPLGFKLNTAGTFVLWIAIMLSSSPPPPKVNPFLESFSSQTHARYHIFKKYISLGLYLKLFPKVWRTLKIQHTLLKIQKTWESNSDSAKK